MRPVFGLGMLQKDLLYESAKSIFGDNGSSQILIFWPVSFAINDKPQVEQVSVEWTTRDNGVEAGRGREVSCQKRQQWRFSLSATKF
jgi:hypothetical protein